MGDSLIRQALQTSLDGEGDRSSLSEDVFTIICGATARTTFLAVEFDDCSHAAAWVCSCDALRHGTRSVPRGVPTQSVGTINDQAPAPQGLSLARHACTWRAADQCASSSSS